MAPILCVPAPLVSAAPPREPVDLVRLQWDDEAVLTVGYRLQTRARDLCPIGIPVIGLSVHDFGQYGPAYRAAAAGLFERADLPAVLAIAHGGAADRAGVRAGDAIVAVGDVPVPLDANGLGRIEEVLRRIDVAAASGRVDLALIRGGRPFSARITAVKGCATRFQTRVAGELNAKANGERVEITTGLLHFVRGPDELAAVLGHELAHNVLHHRDRLDRSGRSKRQVRQTETEADQLSVYLLDRAGYSTAAILSFWERMRHEHGGGLFASKNHPTDKQRIVAIGAEIDRLARLKAQGSPLMPAFLGAARLPPTVARRR